uniref:Uncharacterized protein n=1 Tax=Arundo donax TaxID=35708 RepID=A0A0A8XXR0_ARUDO
MQDKSTSIALHTVQTNHTYSVNTVQVVDKLNCHSVVGVRRRLESRNTSSTRHDFLENQDDHWQQNLCGSFRRIHMTIACNIIDMVSLRIRMSIGSTIYASVFWRNCMSTCSTTDARIDRSVS